MIPLCLMAGFLGAGKTSVLEHIARDQDNRQILFLVNEMSIQDVDGTRLSATHPYVVKLPGGSIFCSCLVSEFIRQMRAIHRDYPGIGGIVIEASGMANPLVVHRLLRESRLTDLFSLRSVVVVVDPDTFARLREVLPSLTTQIEAANLIIINKVDLHPQSLVEQTESGVRQLNARAPLVRATFGRVSLDWFAPHPWPIMAGGEFAPCRDPLFVAQFVPVSAPLNLNHFQTNFERVQNDFYRLKGFVSTDNGWSYLDFPGDQLRCRDVPCPVHPSGLAVILRAEAGEETSRFLRQLAS